MGKEGKKRRYDSTIALPAFIILLVIVFYIPSMKGGFIWDDDDYVTKNENLKTWNGLKKIWFDVGATYQYYPMVHTSFWLEYHIWKHKAFGYHAVNVLLHALNAVMVFFILLKLGQRWAWFAALVFALHPVQVESVAWITERKNVLSGFFYLLSLFSYLNFREVIDGSVLGEAKLRKKPGEKKERSLWVYYAISLVFFVCALFSKTVTSSLPVVLLLILWWKGRKLVWRDILLLVPFFIIGGIMGSITARMERYQIGAMGAKWDWSFIERCLIAGRALWFYAVKIIVPHPLIFIYPKWRIDAAKALQYIYPAGVLVVFSVLLAMKHRIGRGPLAGVLYFSATLFPALGFFNVYPMLYSYVADHFQYLASIGMIALFTGAIAFALKRIFGDEKKIQIITGCFIILVLGFLTWRQGLMYRNLETLWKTTLAKNPEAWLAHNNMGTVLLDQGKTDEAIAHFTEALRINPDYDIAYYNLGFSHVKKGDNVQGIKCYKKAIELNPEYTNAYINLGMAYDALGDHEQAIQNYNKARNLKPESEVVYCSLGDAYSSFGSLDKAIGYYKKCLELNPEYVEAHYSLGSVLFEKNDAASAIRHFNEAIRLKPNYDAAHNNLGIIFASIGETDKAMEHYSAALRINPGSAGTLNNMGLLLVQTGRTDEAIYNYKKAIEIDPQTANYYLNLAEALFKKGTDAEAMDTLYKGFSLCSVDPWIPNKISWILATDKRAEIRNAGEAVRLGEIACRLTENREPTILDTLAAAYAEAGRFDDALQTAETALKLSRDLKQDELAKDIEARIELFKAGKPFRE